MRVDQLADGLWRLPTVPVGVNGYLVAGRDGLTLVDPGLALTFRRLVSGIEAAGHSASRITRIVVTHAHLDHAGALTRLKAISGARVFAHAADRAFIEAGDAPPGDPSTIRSRFGSRLPFSGFRACPIDDVLADGDEVGPLRVLHTPGHTPGHISLLHTDAGVLITGDAVINLWRVRYPLTPFCSSLADVRTSAARLAERDVVVAAIAHGRPARDRIGERLRALAAG